MTEKALAKLAELTKIAETLSNDPTQNNRTVSDAFMNLAEWHFSVGNYKAAGYYYEQAFKYRRNYLLDRDNAKCCILAGIAHYRSGNIIQAERFFGYSVPAAKHANSDYYICVGTSNMALVQMLQGRSAKAIELTNDSLETAKELFPPHSPEYLEFVRLAVNVLIQSNQFETADSLIQGSEFCADERAVLRAGIATILQDHDKGIAILKEAETLRAEIVSAQSSIPTLPAITSPRDGDPSATDAAALAAQKAQQEAQAAQAKLDNAKRKDFSYRELMASCLVDYNLSILHSYKADHEQEKVYLEKSCDGMVLLLSRATAETNETHLLQSQADRIRKDNVLPTLDTLLSVHLLHAHVMLSRIVNKLTYTPLLPSIKLQACHSLLETEDEYPELIQIISDLNSLFLLWEQNAALNTMTQIENFQKTNPVTVLSLKNSAVLDSGAPVLSSQSNSISIPASGELPLETSPPSSEDYNDTANVDSMLAQQLVSNVSLLTTFSRTGTLKNPTETNLLSRSHTLPPESAPNTADASATAAASTSSPLPSPRASKKTGAGGSKKKEKADKKEAGAGKKKKKAPGPSKTKSQTSIPTHGSLKVEMAPQCHLSKIEGLSQHDKVIANALFQCQGLGYGFMCGGGSSGGIDPSHVSTEDPEQLSEEYAERLVALKKQLLETEAALLPVYDELNQLPLSVVSSQHRNIHGTVLSLYLTLCQLCFQLNHRKDANVFIEKYLAYCKTHLPGDSHHLAFGLRLQLDHEEWVTAASLPSMISQQKLRRLQELLGLTKRYFLLTERVRGLDQELHYDAWRRLINLYADISSVPDTPGTPKPPSTETLLENLSLLTPDEMDQLEETDVAWLKLYSRLRGKALASRLTVAMKSSYQELMASDELAVPGEEDPSPSS